MKEIKPIHLNIVYMPFVKNLKETLTIKSLQEGEEEKLSAFARSLSVRSKRLFAPYRWNSEHEREDLAAAVEGSATAKHPAFLAYLDNKPAAYGVLWNMIPFSHGGWNDILVPTAGLCVTDKYQGKGIGNICLEELIRWARDFKADAIELTHAPENTASANLAGKHGFAFIGEIAIPLGVNPASTTAEPPLGYRTEKQLLRVLNEQRRKLVYNYARGKQTP